MSGSQHRIWTTAGCDRSSVYGAASTSRQGSNVLEDFKKFIFRGNVIDLAVAVIIGAAFSVVVNSLVQNILMPIIGIVGGKPSFDDYTITINKSVIKWGSFVTSVVNFVIIAAAIFVTIKAFERLQDMRRRGDEPVTDEPLTVEGALPTEIRDLIRSQRPPGAPSSPGTPVSPEG